MVGIYNVWIEVEQVWLEKMEYKSKKVLKAKLTKFKSQDEAKEFAEKLVDNHKKI